MDVSYQLVTTAILATTKKCQASVANGMSGFHGYVRTLNWILHIVLLITI